MPQHRCILTAEANVEVLNHALSDIPPDAVRIHLCWGNYEGPHHRDIPIEEIIGVVLKARPQAFSFEAANPRHEHEWEVFKTTPRLLRSRWMPVWTWLAMASRAK